MPQLSHKTYLKITSVINRAIGSNDYHIEFTDNPHRARVLAEFNVELESALQMLHDDYLGKEISKNEERAAQTI